jgi:DNA-binding MarR family transcriptional regulator
MAVKSNSVRRERKIQPGPVISAGAAVKPVGPAGAPKLDRLIHERLRLGILSALSVNESLTFNELKKLLDTTDGNLSVHARKLEEAGYIACAKSFEGRVPRTDYRLTPSGKRALERYLDHMEALIRAMREK